MQPFDFRAAVAAAGCGAGVHAGASVVLKDGAPSCVFPSFEATVDDARGRRARVAQPRAAQRAREDVAAVGGGGGRPLRSAYARDLPALDIDGRPTAEEEGEWAPLLPLTDAKPALETLSRVSRRCPRSATTPTCSSRCPARRRSTACAPAGRSACFCRTASASRRRSTATRSGTAARPTSGSTRRRRAARARTEVYKGLLE